jgi:hypothetical protein
MQGVLARAGGALGRRAPARRGLADAAAAAATDKLNFNFFLPHHAIKKAANVVRRPCIRDLVASAARRPLAENVSDRLTTEIVPGAASGAQSIADLGRP